MLLKQLTKISVKIKDLTAILSRIDNKHTPHGVDVYPASAAGVPFTAAYDAVMIRISFYLLFIFENTSFKFIFLLASNSILSINLLNTCLVIFSVFKNSSDSFLI